MTSTRERRLGRGLDSFSHLFFSGGDEKPPAANAPDPAADATNPADPRPTDPRPTPERAPCSQPRTLFVTGFRRGCGKTRIASEIAEACRSMADGIAEWQLGPGVIVPRHGGRFGLPVPHPSDRRAFDQLSTSVGGREVLLLDGPSTLIGDGDPFALSAEEFLVIALPGQEGAAEGYASVKEIVTALPDAVVRVVVNRASSQDEAREVFHRIADVAERHLGRVIRSYGGLSTLGSRGAAGAGAGESSGARDSAGAHESAEGRSPLFSRIAHAIVARARRAAPQPAYFEAAWSRCAAGRG